MFDLIYAFCTIILFLYFFLIQFCCFEKVLFLVTILATANLKLFWMFLGFSGYIYLEEVIQACTSLSVHWQSQCPKRDILM